ncbi:MAG: hypothetical protein MZV70_49590 [Desulfobacterales bacterium]|nr:hypothetical protein [Desulfobacterales bacterium]
MELIKSGEEWSLVRLANGAEGYVLARYLTSVQPGRFQYDTAAGQDQGPDRPGGRAWRRKTAG